jgi:hypothetical protein
MTRQRHNDIHCQSELGWAHWLGSDGLIGWARMGYSDTEPGSVYQLLSLDTQLRYLTWLDTG